MNRDPAAAVFADPDAPATCLVAVAVDRFGADCLGWAPETWRLELRDETGADPHPRNLDRVAAACVLLTRPDEFYSSAAGFGDLAQALAGEWFDPDVWHPPTTAECLWAAVEAYLLDPPDDPAAPRYSREVSAYATAVARGEGFPRLPRAFAAFGIAEDPDARPAHDYSADPLLADMSRAAAESLEADLDAWLASRLADLAARVDALPLRSGAGPAVAAEIRKYV